MFANRAAEKILGSQDPIRSPGHGILGKGPNELGINLREGKTWALVLGDLESAHNDIQSEEERVHEVAATVSTPSKGDLQFRVLISTLTAGDGCHFVLSFERSSEEQKASTKQDYLPAGPGPTIIPTKGQPEDLRSKIQRFKLAVFDSCATVGFILTADEKFYLSNKATREKLGPIMGGPEGCDGSSFRSELEVWDETFTNLLEPSEFPAIRVVRTRKPFTDCKYGFTHAGTGHKAVMNVSGECLFDDETGEFLGGLCWCKDLQDYSEFIVAEQQRRLHSHETICNLMPHMVWTTTQSGEADYFSQRVCFPWKFPELY